MFLLLNSTNTEFVKKYCKLRKTIQKNKNKMLVCKKTQKNLKWFVIFSLKVFYKHYKHLV